MGRRRTGDCRKRTGGSDLRESQVEAVDRISSLPDSLLLHVLSFLPFRCAVRTSLMLPPFRGLWRSLRSLSFEECDFHCCSRGLSKAGGVDGLSNFVDHVLALHESCEVDRFRIELDFHMNAPVDPESAVYNSEVANRLDRWICSALKKKVKALDVALVGCGGRLKAPPAFHYRMSSALLNNSLVELCLHVCNLESLGQIQLRSLRKLSLWDVNLSDEVMRNLVLGSPSLKKVSFLDCHGLQVLKIDSHPSLEELNVCFCHGLQEIDLARSGIKIFAIAITHPLRKTTCPNVVTLELDASIKEVNITCGSSVNDMALYIRRGFNGAFQGYPEVKTLLEKVHNAAYFTLCNWSIMVFSIWKLTNQPRLYFNWKSVTTTLNLAKWHLPGISYLLETCNFLETLTIYVYKKNPKDIQGKKWNRTRNFNGRRYWNSIDGTFHCLKHHLKNVMIYACVTEPYVIEFIEFLLGNALILEKMVISTKKKTGVTRNGESHYFDVALEEDFTDALVGFSRKVFSFPRISPRAVVHID